MSYQKARLVAEVGCNHKGEMEIAKEMIKIAAIFVKQILLNSRRGTTESCLQKNSITLPTPILQIHTAKHTVPIGNTWNLMLISTDSL